MDATALLVNLAVTLGVAVAGGLVAFGFGAALGKHRVVDIAWGLGFAAVALTTLVLSSGDGDGLRRWLVTGLTMAWGLRLAVHIGWRGWGHPEDPRYARLLSKARGNRNLYALRMVYLLQAGLVWFVSLPVQVAQYEPRPVSAGAAWFAVAGVVVWVVGMFFETVGDAQLARFRGDPGNKGRVLDSGLWRFTRHPNYFGDACVWWGLYLLACGSWWGAATILSPVVMTYFLAGKTGKPLMDAHLRQTRPGYAAYLERTSGFIPWPPRG